MTVKICTCEQCRAQKRNKSGNTKKRIRRYLNRLRRRNDDGKAVNWYWA